MAAERRGPPDLPPGAAQNLVDLYRRLRGDLSIGQIATRLRMSGGYLSDVFAGWRVPRPATAATIATGLRGTDRDAANAYAYADEIRELRRYNRARAARSTGPAVAGTTEAVAPTVTAAPTAATANRAEPPGLVFRLLGPVTAHGDGGPVNLGGGTARAVLAALLYRAERGASVDDLVRWVWGAPGAAARASVYKYVSNLRAALAPLPGVVLAARQARYQIEVEPDAVDWHRFRQLVARARESRADGRIDRAGDQLHQGLALWRGEPLADIDDRLASFRTGMIEQRASAIELLAEIEADRCRPDVVVALLHDDLAPPRDGLSGGPIRERSATLLIDALTAMGRRDDAAAVYRRVRARLADEQGIEPGTELQAAHRRALASVPLPPVLPRPRTAPGAGEPPSADVATSASEPPVIEVAEPPISNLPDPDPHFVGRGEQLRKVGAALTGAGSRLVVVAGMGGSGKTTLAVRAAEILAADFPDGTMLLDLHGFAGDRAPLSPGDAADRLLRRMRLDGRVIPDDPDERVAFYRDRVAGRRMLIILDNAHDTAQVRPLLPGGPGTGVIVTSRSSLAALDASVTVRLDTLTDDEAVKLFRSVAGDDRLRTEPGADQSISTILERCGHLPLAVRITAGRYRVRNTQRLTDLETELPDNLDALDGLADDEHSVVRTLRESVADLPPALVRTFSLLAVDPGADRDAYATAALTGTSLAEATRHLGTLVDLSLLIAGPPGRFRFHDLVKAYARRHVPLPEPAPVVLHRLADYYLRTAERADRLVTPKRHRVPIAELDRAAVLPEMPDYGTALEWLVTERSNIADTCVSAGESGLDVACWQLAYTLRGYFYLTKDVGLWTRTHDAALAATRRLGDARAEATVLNDLGLAQLEQNHPAAAADYYRHALTLFTEAHDEHGANNSRANLAWIAYSDGRYEDFLDEIRPALDFYRANGAERSEAITLRGIGLAESRLGRTVEAIADLDGALALFQTMGGPLLDIAMSWNGLGEAHQQVGDHSPARAAFTEGLAVAERSGSRFERGRAHQRLAEIDHADGDPAGARAHWTAALADYERTSEQHASAVRSALRGLDDLGS